MNTLLISAQFVHHRVVPNLLFIVFNRKRQRLDPHHVRYSRRVAPLFLHRSFPCQLSYSMIPIATSFLIPLSKTILCKKMGFTLLPKLRIFQRSFPNPKSISSWKSYFNLFQTAFQPKTAYLNSPVQKHLTPNKETTL